MTVALVRRYIGQRVFIGDAEIRISNIDGKMVSLAITSVSSRVYRPSKDEDKKDRETARKAWLNTASN